jgi:hypothetical protein
MNSEGWDVWGLLDSALGIKGGDANKKGASQNQVNSTKSSQDSIDDRLRGKNDRLSQFRAWPARICVIAYKFHVVCCVAH